MTTRHPDAVLRRRSSALKQMNIHCNSSTSSAGTTSPVASKSPILSPRSDKRQNSKQFRKSDSSLDHSLLGSSQNASNVNGGSGDKKGHRRSNSASSSKGGFAARTRRRAKSWLPQPKAADACSPLPARLLGPVVAGAWCGLVSDVPSVPPVLQWSVLALLGAGLPSSDDASFGTLRQRVTAVLVSVDDASCPLAADGLFRISADAAEVANLKSEFDKLGVHVPHYPDHDGDEHVVAGVLKKFLRDLPDPLCTFALHGSFCAAGDIAEDSPEVGTAAVLSIAAWLPVGSLVSLATVCLLLNQIARWEHVNRMSVHNLAIVFAPALFRRPVAEDGTLKSLKSDLENLHVLQHVTALLIDHAHELADLAEQVESRSVVTKSYLSSIALPEHFWRSVDNDAGVIPAALSGLRKLLLQQAASASRIFLEEDLYAQLSTVHESETAGELSQGEAFAASTLLQAGLFGTDPDAADACAILDTLMRGGERAAEAALDALTPIARKEITECCLAMLDEICPRKAVGGQPHLQRSQTNLTLDSARRETLHTHIQVAGLATRAEAAGQVTPVVDGSDGEEDDPSHDANFEDAKQQQVQSVRSFDEFTTNQQITKGVGLDLLHPSDESASAVVGWSSLDPAQQLRIPARKMSTAEQTPLITSTNARVTRSPLFRRMLLGVALLLFTLGVIALWEFYIRASVLIMSPFAIQQQEAALLQQDL